MHWRFGAKGNFVPILKKQEKKEKDRQARRKGEEEGGKEPTCPTRGPLFHVLSTFAAHTILWPILMKIVVLLFVFSQG